MGGLDSLQKKIGGQMLTRREFSRYLLYSFTGIAGLQFFKDEYSRCSKASEGLVAGSEMQMRKVGNTGLKIRGVSFCTSQLSTTGWEPLEKALRLGVNYIDTSPTYDSSQELIGKNLFYWTDKVIFSTRWSTDGTATAESLINTFETSRKLLRTNYIDLILTDNVTDSAQLKCIGSKEAFNTLKREKKVGFRGLATNVNQKQILQDAFTIGGFDFLLLAYNILNYRDLRGPVEKLARRGMGIVATNVLEASLENPSLARRLLGKKEKSLASASIKWVLGEGWITSILVPIRTVQEVEEYVQAVIEFEEG